MQRRCVILEDVLEHSIAELLAVSDSAAQAALHRGRARPFRERDDALPSYFIEVAIANGKVVSIRDYRHVPYIAVDARIELAEAPFTAPAS